MRADVHMKMASVTNHLSLRIRETSKEGNEPAATRDSSFVCYSTRQIEIVDASELQTTAATLLGGLIAIIAGNLIILIKIIILLCHH